MNASSLPKELILFYNAENFFSPDQKPIHRLDPTVSGLRNWDDYKYRNKLFKTAHLFQLVQEAEGVLPMLMGLSEIQSDGVLEDLLKQPPFSSDFSFVHYDSLDERGVDVAMVYDKTKLELLSSEPITFFFEIKDNNPENYDTTRDVLWCRLRYRGAVINFFVCHLPSKRENDINKPKRGYILNELRKKITEIVRSQGEAVIICGDFNENPNEENVTHLLADDGKGVLLRNPFSDLFQNSHFSTYHYQDGLLFDQIILSEHFFTENFELRYHSASVFNSEKISSWNKNFPGRPFRTYAGSRYLGGYSDHFPVYVHLINK